MKKITHVIFLLLAGLAFNSYGQKIDSQKQRQPTEVQKQKLQRNFYRKTLQVDSVKAEQVSRVQDSYKVALKLVIADTSLNEAAKRVKIKALMDNKNQQLRRMLTPAQQEKIIPSTEREVPKSENSLKRY